jgi:hypothetical protein
MWRLLAGENVVVRLGDIGCSARGLGRSSHGPYWECRAGHKYYKVCLCSTSQSELEARISWAIVKCSGLLDCGVMAGKLLHVSLSVSIRFGCHCECLTPSMGCSLWDHRSSVPGDEGILSSAMPSAPGSSGADHSSFNPQSHAAPDDTGADQLWIV